MGGNKDRADILFQKKEINGVYLGADRYLIGVNDPEKYTEQMEDSRIASLKKTGKPVGCKSHAGTYRG